MAAECDIIMPTISVQGGFASLGSVQIPILTINGRMRDSIYGLVLLYSIIIDGDITVTARIDGLIVIQSFFVSGDMQSEGSLTIEAMRIDGMVTQYGVITGSIVAPSIGIIGSASAAQFSSGSISLPALLLFGVMVQSGRVELSGDVSLPQVRVLGSMSTYQDHSFGSETDSVLRYSATRRRI